MFSLPSWPRRAAFAVVLLAAPVGQVEAVPPLPEWLTTLNRDDPQVGTIRRADGQVITPAGLIEALSQANFVLLGEKHDNPDHHRLQEWVIEALIQAGHRPAVVFEMIGADQAPALAQFLGTSQPDPASLGEAINWTARGWPSWSLYRPIAEVALRAGLPLMAGDLSRPTQRAISREGTARVDPATAARLSLDIDYPPDLAASLAEELQASHCGHLPAAELPRMMDVQRARDASMAVALVEAAAKPGIDRAVLIAGAGHVRLDRGVPWHLRRLAPAKSSKSVAFAEVSAKPDDATPSSDRPFDFVWTTPRVDDADPCEKFSRQLQRMRPP